VLITSRHAASVIGAQVRDFRDLSMYVNCPACGEKVGEVLGFEGWDKAIGPVSEEVKQAIIQAVEQDKVGVPEPDKKTVTRHSSFLTTFSSEQPTPTLIGTAKRAYITPAKPDNACRKLVSSLNYIGLANPTPSRIVLYYRTCQRLRVRSLFRERPRRFYRTV
jgi:hypothetical protein